MGEDAGGGGRRAGETDAGMMTGVVTTLVVVGLIIPVSYCRLTEPWR